MALTRRTSREKAVQVLYSLEFNKQESLASYLKQYQEEIYKNLSKDEYLIKILMGIEQNVDELDEVIQDLSDIPFLDISILKLCILRVALYEIKIEKIPDAVVVNEAVEIAKMFGTLRDGHFINALLRQINQ
jgi:N utilization substance protein B